MSAPAPSVQSLEEFLRVVRASGLVDPEALDTVAAPWTDTKGPVPEALTQAMLQRELLSDWQLGQLRRGKHKGFILGKYKLIRELGAGGMGTVFLGEHLTLHNKVAIKVLPLKRVEQTSYLKRFELEAQASARLNHPNIARAFDLDSSGAIHFIAMEHVDGTDLYSRVKKQGPLPVREAADFIRQAALGLHHAHEEGLVHRDIKPANLMVDQRGTVKILDLGLALSKEEETSLTQEFNEKMLGTADYLAPEQARDSHLADRRSDIYSLGCTLHYLLIGTPPFAKGKLGERIRAHMQAPPPNLLDTRPDVPAAIVELYFRMMEKHPDARPQTAQDVADALATWLASTTDGQPRARPERPSRESLRRSTTSRTAPGGATPGPSTVASASTTIQGSSPGKGSSPTQSSAAGQGSGAAGIASQAGVPGQAAAPSRKPAAETDPAAGLDLAGIGGSDPHPSYDASALSFLLPGPSATPPRGSPQPPTRAEASSWGGIQINTAPTARPATVPANAAGAGAKPAAKAHSGGSAAAGLSKRYGPLPLWAWLLGAACVIGAAGAGAWFLMQPRADGEPTSEDAGDEPPAQAEPRPKPNGGGEKAGTKAKPAPASSTSKRQQTERNPPKPKPKKPAEPEPAGPSPLDNLGGLKPGADADSPPKPDGENPSAEK